MTSARGQSIVEYALLLAIVVATLLATQRFMKASLMGRWRDIADGYGFGRLYEGKQTGVAIIE